MMLRKLIPKWRFQLLLFFFLPVLSGCATANSTSGLNHPQECKASFHSAPSWVVSGRSGRAEGLLMGVGQASLNAGFSTQVSNAYEEARSKALANMLSSRGAFISGEREFKETFSAQGNIIQENSVTGLDRQRMQYGGAVSNLTEQHWIDSNGCVLFVRVEAAEKDLIKDHQNWVKLGELDRIARRIVDISNATTQDLLSTSQSKINVLQQKAEEYLQSFSADDFVRLCSAYSPVFSCDKEMTELHFSRRFNDVYKRLEQLEIQKIIDSLKASPTLTGFMDALQEITETKTASLDEQMNTWIQELEVIAEELAITQAEGKVNSYLLHRYQEMIAIALGE